MHTSISLMLASALCICATGQTALAQNPFGHPPVRIAPPSSPTVGPIHPRENWKTDLGKAWFKIAPHADDREWKREQKAPSVVGAPRG